MEQSAQAREGLPHLPQSLQLKSQLRAEIMNPGEMTASGQPGFPGEAVAPTAPPIVPPALLQLLALRGLVLAQAAAQPTFPGTPLDLSLQHPLEFLGTGILSTQEGPSPFLGMPPIPLPKAASQLPPLPVPASKKMSPMPVELPPLVPPLAALPLTVATGKARKKRARILQDGELTMIVYGSIEALTWARRVAVFQTAMRDVLGDRRRTFTWSGSVTDSVVGAFLTQNVSDALSSRAYMEVASRWPAEGVASAVAEHGREITDTVDWEAVRTVPVQELADAIKCRGMQFLLAATIQEFLNGVRERNLQRLAEAWAAEAEDQAAAAVLSGVVATVSALAPVADGPVQGAAAPLSASPRCHVDLEYEAEGCEAESTTSTPGLNSKAATSEEQFNDVYVPAQEDFVRAYAEHQAPAQELLSLEWLREAPDQVSRDYLMSVNRLGRKSVGCIMLLALGKKEFPVDTNVGRISARLGWIPLEASQAIEDMDEYAPEPEVHAYLHSRLLGFDVETLYELHYQMITLGKVFCSKVAPNCRACPMRNECEYALHNGPSLHGRKRAKAAQQPQDPRSPPVMTVLSTPLVDSSGGEGAGKGQFLRQIGRPVDGDVHAGAQRVHWKTQQRMERLERERLQRERLHSSLSLEELVAAAPSRPRTNGLRRPRRAPPEEALSSLLPRARAELRFQAGKAMRERKAASRMVRWLPLHLMRRSAAEQPSVWDVPPSSAADDAMEISAGMEAAAGASEAQGSDEQSAPVLKKRTAFFTAGGAVSVWDMAYLVPPVQVQLTTTSAPAPPLPAYEADMMVEREQPPQQQQEEEGLPTSRLPPPPLPHPQQQQQQEEVLQGVAAGKVVAAEAGAQSEAEVTCTEAKDALPPEVVLVLTPDAVLGPAVLDDEDFCDAAAADGPLPKQAVLPGVGYVAPAAVLLAPAAVPLTEAEIAAECERLQQLGSRMAVVSEAMLVAECRGDTRVHRDRLLELSLQVLGMDAAMTVESASSVISGSKRQYHRLAKVLHPDKCSQPGAESAFAALGRAMRIISEHSSASSGATQSPAAGGAACGGQVMPNEAAAGAAGPDAVGLLHSGEGLLDEIVWTQNRLVLQSLVLPPHLHSQLPLHSDYPKAAPGGAGDEPLLFVPLSTIPTFQRGSIGPAGGSRDAAAEVTAVVDVLVEGVVKLALADAAAAEPSCPPASERATGGSAVEEAVSGGARSGRRGQSVLGLADEDGELVEGVLLVTCRAALQGRFPLNGTYFQINEVFADNKTVQRPLKLPRSLLEGCKICAVHFGLGIHYMTKAMSQAEVAHMFANGWVCFRAFDPTTRAPVLLPPFLMPSIPTQTKSTWRNKDERAADRAAKASKQRALLPTPPAPLVRTIRIPLSPEEVLLLPPTLVSGTPPSKFSLEDLAPMPPPAPRPPPQRLATPKKRPLPPVSTAHLAAPPGPDTPEAAEKQRVKKKEKKLEEAPRFGGPNEPKSLAAALAKSGRGRSRVNLHPVIQSSQRCGHCKPCLNLHWKKACETRRVEMVQATSYSGLQQPAVPPPPVPPPG